MSKPITIRSARWDDLPEILDLQARSMRELAVAFYEPEAIEAFIEFGTMDTSLLDDSSYFVVIQASRIVATGGWSSRRPRYEAHATDKSEPIDLSSEATIRSLYVHPDSTRQGIASQLMEHIESEIRAAGYHVAHLTATLSGIPLYRRLGWRSHEGITITLSGDIKLVGLRMTKRIALPSSVAA